MRRRGTESKKSHKSGYQRLRGLTLLCNERRVLCGRKKGSGIW